VSVLTINMSELDIVWMFVWVFHILCSINSAKHWFDSYNLLHRHFVL